MKTFIASVVLFVTMLFASPAAAARLSVDAPELAHWGDQVTVVVASNRLYYDFVRVECEQNGVTQFAAVDQADGDSALFTLTPKDVTNLSEPTYCRAEAVVVGRGDWRVLAADDFVVT